MGRATAICAVVASLLLVACGGGSSANPTAAPATTVVTPAGSATKLATTPSAGAPAASASAATSSLTLTSDAFADGARIPPKHTCAAEGVSPALAWSGAPAGTAGYALIVIDPDAPIPGGVTHWVVYDLPAAVTKLPEGVREGGSIPGGGTQGLSIKALPVYAPPCPPPGAPPSHFRFHLYVLDAALGLDAATSKADVLRAMQGHIIAETELVGLFSR